MWNDPIVAEVRAVRDAHARLHRYDSDRIFHDLKEQESRSGRKYFRLRSRRLPARSAKTKRA